MVLSTAKRSGSAPLLARAVVVLIASTCHWRAFEERSAGGEHIPKTGGAHKEVVLANRRFSVGHEFEVILLLFFPLSSMGGAGGGAFLFYEIFGQ